MIVGITGMAGAGKDSVFRVAQNRAHHFGLPDPVRLAFADKLKASAAEVLGISVDVLDELKMMPDARVSVTVRAGNMPSSISVREFLQRYGTEGHRDIFGTNFWVDAMLPKGFDHAGHFIMVTDVRFPNEADRIRELGGVIIKVEGGEKGDHSGHTSETALDRYPVVHTIVNTVRDDNQLTLIQQVDELLIALKTEAIFLSTFGDAPGEEFGSPKPLRVDG